MKKRIIVIAIAVLLVGFATWAFTGKVKAEQQAKGTLEQAIAISAFKSQYGKFLDAITIQDTVKSEGVVIYWTENTTGKTILHGSAFINNTLYDSQTTRDVTDLIKK